jgi:hypothetical protein
MWDENSLMTPVKKHGIRRLPLLDANGAHREVVWLDDNFLEAGEKFAGVIAEVTVATHSGAHQDYPMPSADDRAL